MWSENRDNVSYHNQKRWVYLINSNADKHLAPGKICLRQTLMEPCWSVSACYLHTMWSYSPPASTILIWLLPAPTVWHTDSETVDTRLHNCNETSQAQPISAISATIVVWGSHQNKKLVIFIQVWLGTWLYWWCPSAHLFKVFFWAKWFSGGMQ